MQNKDNPNIFIENIFFLTTSVLIDFKIIQLEIHHQDVKSFLNLNLEKSYFPRSDEEILIFKKSQSKQRLVIYCTKFKSTVFICKRVHFLFLN